MLQQNVDSRMRTYLLDEFQRDVNAGRLHVPTELSQLGAGDWPILLQLTLMESGPDELAQHLRDRGRMRDPDQAITVAHAAFRRLHGRAICRRAIDDGSPEVEVVAGTFGSATARRHRLDARRLLEALRAAPDADEEGLHHAGFEVARPEVDRRPTLAA